MDAAHVVLGTGAIGRAIMDELVSRGDQVRMVNRSGRLEELPPGVELRAADLYDQEAVREVTRGAKVVYQASTPRYREWPTKFPVLQEAILGGLKGSESKLVIVENLYLYGPTNGTPMTEATPLAAHTRKGRTRAELSRAALTTHRRGDVRITIGRGSDYFGPWGLQSAMGARVFYPLLNGKPAQVLGRTDLPHTHTFTSDFGRALVLLGERADADGQAWHVPNDSPLTTQGELIRMFAEEAGVPARMRPLGRAAMRLAGLFLPDARESAEMMYEFDQPFVVDSSRFEKTFGLKATPLPEAIRKTVAWYRTHPLRT